MHSFLTFAENPDNLPQMEEWGLALKNERLAQALQTQDANSVLPGSLEPGKEIASGKSDESDAAEQLFT